MRRGIEYSICFGNEVLPWFRDLYLLESYISQVHLSLVTNCILHSRSITSFPHLRMALNPAEMAIEEAVCVNKGPPKCVQDLVGFAIWVVQQMQNFAPCHDLSSYLLSLGLMAAFLALFLVPVLLKWFLTRACLCTKNLARLATHQPVSQRDDMA